MHDTDDLVISVAKGMYHWREFVPFVASLEAVGFRGTKVFFVDNILPEVRSNLIAHGFSLVDFTSPETTWQTFGRVRLAPVLTFLKENFRDFRYLIFPDWRDLVFQTNPFIWLEKNLSPPHKLLGCSEIVKIKDQITMRTWVQHIVDQDTFSWLGEHDICCCGTIAGESQAAYELMCRIYESLSVDDPLRVDQGVLNYLLRVSPFKEITRVPKYEEGFVATVGWIKGLDYEQHKDHFTDSVPDFNESTGLVCPRGKTEPFSIVHQYDRSSSWMALMKKRYMVPPKDRSLRRPPRLGR